jgi:hypothetical protein
MKQHDNAPKKKAPLFNVNAVAQQYSSSTFFSFFLIISRKILSNFSNFFFLFKNWVCLKLLSLKLLNQRMPLFFVIWKFSNISLHSIYSLNFSYKCPSGTEGLRPYSKLPTLRVYVVVAYFSGLFHKANSGSVGQWINTNFWEDFEGYSLTYFAGRRINWNVLRTVGIPV